MLSLNTSSAGLPPILEVHPEAAGEGCAFSLQEVDEVADPELRLCGVWRWQRGAVTLHRCDMQHVLSLRRAAAHSTAQAVTSASSLVCSCSLGPAGRAVAALHSLGRCQSTEKLPGSRSLVAFPRMAGFVCFPSKFRLEHASTTWLSETMSAQGTRTFYPDFPLMGRKFSAWSQGSAVSDTRCGTPVRPQVGFC